MNRHASTLEQLLHELLGREEPASLEPMRTELCPSIRGFELHINETAFLSVSAMQHVNLCPRYCQPLFQAFLRVLDKQPTRFENPVVERLVAASKESAGTRRYQAIVRKGRNATSLPGIVEITDGPFISEDRALLCRLAVVEPSLPPELLPLRVSIGSLIDAGEIVAIFDLPLQAEQMVKLRIHGDLADRPAWKEQLSLGRIPVGFVLTPLGLERLEAQGGGVVSVSRSEGPF